MIKRSTCISRSLSCSTAECDRLVLTIPVALDGLIWASPSWKLSLESVARKSGWSDHTLGQEPNSLASVLWADHALWASPVVMASHNLALDLTLFEHSAWTPVGTTAQDARIPQALVLGTGTVERPTRDRSIFISPLDDELVDLAHGENYAWPMPARSA